MGHDLKFKMAAMPIYSKNHSNDFYPRTTRPIRLIFCRKHLGHHSIYNAVDNFFVDGVQYTSCWLNLVYPKIRMCTSTTYHVKNLIIVIVASPLCTEG